MSYVSLYRKYRSQTFDDVMGQDHVTKTLQNAIRLGKVAHAYLFCGTRGTGKTTTARLLAKSLNCVNGPTPQPCNTCPACLSITEGSAMDIIEMDAASHRGVKDVEQIRDNVKFPPMELRYKVFIIDEAHQLSGDAKDAFLKTLEEPPPHAIFILATTESQSIPVTIRSRCQQFDFRRGSLRDILGRLKHVTDSEGVEAESEALDLMAVAADGSWRDALSLLEQVLAYTDGKVTVEDVNTVLGTVTQDFLFRLVDTLADGDERGAFAAAEEAVNSGKDIQQLLKSIAQHFRNLLFALVSKNLSELTTNEEAYARMRDQASKFSKQALLKSVEILSETEKNIRFSDQHRLLLELALLKIIEAARPSEQVVESAPALRPAPPVQRPRPQPQPTVQPVQQPAQPAAAQVEPQPEKMVRETPESAAQSAVAGEQSLPEFDRIKARWGQVLQHVKSIDVPAHGLLADVTPAEVRDGSLVLHFKYEGHIKLITMNPGGRGENPKRKALLTALEQVFGVSNPSVIFELGTARKEVPTSEPSDDISPDTIKDNGQETLMNVLDVFPNGKIVDQ